MTVPNEAEPLLEWRVTFGQQYARDPHPTFGAAHPDGWVTIHARSEQAARDEAYTWLGRHWAFMYAMAGARSVSAYAEDGDDVDWGLFPRGELHRFEVTP